MHGGRVGSRPAGVVALVLALCAAGTLALVDSLPAQVGKCTTLQQAYITCGSVTGRNRTIVDPQERFQGVSDVEIESIESTSKAYPSFQFRMPVEPIVSPDLDLGRQPRERFEIFTPIEQPREPRR